MSRTPFTLNRDFGQNPNPGVGPGYGSPLWGGPAPPGSPRGPIPYTWTHTSTIVTVGNVAAIPLAQGGQRVVYADIVSNDSNVVPVFIGNFAVNFTGFGSSYQLEPGSMLSLWVTDVENEKFDLNDFWAASSAGAQVVAVTVWSPVR